MLSVKILGNAQWGRQFFKRPHGAAKKQKVWILIYDDAPAAAYQPVLASTGYKWDEDPGQRQLVPLRGSYKLLVLAANPYPLPPSPVLRPMMSLDSLTFTLTNTLYMETGSDSDSIEVVDGAFLTLLEELHADKMVFDLIDDGGE